MGEANPDVLQGHPKEEYKGVAKFLTFLSSPEVQAKWHQDTGYVPTTLAATPAPAPPATVSRSATATTVRATPPTTTGRAVATTPTTVIHEGSPPSPIEMRLPIGSSPGQ